MAHVLDPSQLRDDTQYCAALDELEDLMLADPGTPAGRRFDELVRLIEDYEVRRDGYDLERMKRTLAADGPR
jgi:HTH-type transcriptional regulator/antitoxin HigA